jgi:hypothetical protein
MVRVTLMMAAGGALLAFSFAGAGRASWLDDAGIQRRLVAGEIVVRSELNQAGARGLIDAAVKIHAEPGEVWSVLRDCKGAPAFIPGLKLCRRIDGAADGSWEIIEHEVKYSWLLPTIHSIFRADYRPLQRIDFHRVAGDLKDEQGVWLLAAVPGQAATILEYQVYVDPGFWIPETLVRHSLRKELPAALAALRTRAESLKRPSALAQP